MITSLKPYPAYKDSGVPWLGPVPAHWEMRKLRQILRQNTERNRPDLPLLSVVREKGVILRNVDNRAENHNYIPDDLSNYKVVHAGQFAINKMKAWQGSYGVSAFEGILSPAYFVFDLVGISGPYFHMSIRSQAYVPFFMQASNGVRVGQWDLSQAQMREIPFVLPLIHEQTAIVRFLDWAEWRIRRVIRARQRRIKLLEEYKQALIHQAVTGEIDVSTGQPYPAYKDSSVEWLGKVPAHWEVRRLRSIAEMRVSSVDKHTKEDEQPVRLCNYTDVYKNERISSAMVFMQATATKDEIERFRLKRGDVLITKDSEQWNDIGVPALVDDIDEDIVCGYHLALLRPFAEMVTSAYLLRALQSTAVAYQFHISANGVTRYGLSHDAIKSVWLPLPPLPEQSAIVEYLDAHTAKIDAAISATRRAIEFLREYRERLVSDVVTGKVDVREVAAQLPEEPPEEESEWVDTEEMAEAETAEDEAAAEALAEEEAEP